MRFPGWPRRYPLPEGVKAALDCLEESGYEAYAVGGCVRDLLLGREPHDWDLTTSARPEQVAEVFAAAGYTVIPQVGEAFAVTLVRKGEEQYEVATFRGETYGRDSHRPESVYYAQTLREDLARRDFTVNAMALDRDGRLHDEYEGRKDCRRRKLQTVGKPEERFHEDALRLFRACRFLSQLDFTPTKELCAAMPSAFARVEGLSLERVKAEVEKILLSSCPARGLDLLVRSGLAECRCRQKRNGVYTEVAILPELAHLPNTPQAQGHRYDAWLHTLVVVQHTPAGLVERWGALFHDVAKGLPEIRAIRDGKITDYGHDKKGADMAMAMLTRWQYPARIVRRVGFLVRMHMHYHEVANNQHADARRWLRKLARSGEFYDAAELTEALEQLGAVCRADILGCGRSESATCGHEAFAAYLHAEMKSMPVRTADLAYSSELPKICGKETGNCLKNLLLRVQNNDLPNEAQALDDAARLYMKRRSQYEAATATGCEKHG